ncbi:MAG: hypothetical protein ACLT76_11805 [Clostridium fessum]
MSEENGRTDLTWRELLDEGGARLSEAGVLDAGRCLVSDGSGVPDRPGALLSWIRTVRSMRNA